MGPVLWVVLLAVTAWSHPLPTFAGARFGAPCLLDFDIDRALAVSPDGARLATSGGDNRVRLWDAATGREPGTYYFQRYPVLDLRWPADGPPVGLTSLPLRKGFLMRAFAGRPWEPDPDDAAVEAAMRAGLRAQSDPLARAFLSADGRWAVGIVDGPAGRRADVYKFARNTASTPATREVSVPVPADAGVWLSQDSTSLLVHEPAADGPGRLRAFALAGPPEKPAWEWAIPGGPGRRPEQCLSPDGRRVVVRAADGWLGLVDGPTGKVVRELGRVPPPHPAASPADGAGVDLSADGKRVAVVHRLADGQVGGRVTDLDTGRDVCALAPRPLPPITGPTRFSADGRRVAQAADGAVGVWDARTGADACPLPGHRGPVASLVAAADGKAVVSAGADQTVRAWEPATAWEYWRTPFPYPVAVRFAAPQGIAVQATRRAGRGRPAALLDPADGRPRPLPGPLGEATSAPSGGAPGRPADEVLALSPDGRAVVTLADGPPALRVWSWPAGELRATVALAPPGRSRLARCAAAQLTPDGRAVVAVLEYDDPEPAPRRGPPPASVERWDLGTGKLLARRAGAPGETPAVLSGPHGLWVLAGPEVRDGATDALVARFPDRSRWPSGGPGRTAALSPDGRMLAVGFRQRSELYLVEVATGQARADLKLDQAWRVAERRPGPVLCFLPGGRLASGLDVALVWRVGLRRHQSVSSTVPDERAWADLANSPADRAWSTMEVLTYREGMAVEFLRGKVRPAPRLEATALDKLLKGLDAPRFEDRETAAAGLDRLGPPAVPAVRARLAGGLSSEAAARAERFLAKHGDTQPTAEEVRALRAAEVLEAIGTPAALAVLEELAGGEPTARLTRDAAGAVRRLRGR